MEVVMKSLFRLLNNQRGNFGSPKIPSVDPVNTAGEDANAARASALAAQSEAEKLKQEKGSAADILTGPGGAISPTTKRKTLLGPE
jgi:hypothetical protein